MTKVWDENVEGYVYVEPDFPRLRYFIDYGIYTINYFGRKLSVAVIGGAYSVDKYYRLTIGAKWFANEQLTHEEKEDCIAQMMNKKFDLVLTHTCPYSIIPTDLFLSGIDQDTVDNSMEHFLDEIMASINWGIWLFGHYHADRCERPKVEQYFHDIENLEDLLKRWDTYDQTHEIPWYITKSPNFDLEVKRKS